MTSRSIRFQLTAWYACVLTAIFVIFGSFLFVHLKGSMEGIVLETEVRRARLIGEAMIVNPSPADLGNLGENIEKFYAPEQNARFIRVSREKGGILYLSGSPSDQSFDPVTVPAIPAWPERISTRRQILPERGALFIAAFRTPAPNDGSYLVEVGTSAGPVDRILGQLRLLFGVGVPVILLVAVGGGYLLMCWALRPVDRMARKAELITQHNLSERLPVVRTGDELERLAESLNHMIIRLEDAFSNSKRFVADASHELRTPLTILRGELENLAQDPQISPELADRLGSLLEETERLSKIVEGLFALSRLDAGEAQVEWVQFDLAALASATAEQMSLLAEDKKITVTREIEQPVLVEGDRARLKQVVVNLLDNAIKYTSEGGEIWIKVRTDDGHAVLEVADTGIGIPSDALPRVFDRFYRVDESRSRYPDGAGLGLAIVKSICNANGGEIEVESPVGRGSSFRVRLPLASGR